MNSNFRSYDGFFEQSLAEINPALADNLAVIAELLPLEADLALGVILGFACDSTHDRLLVLVRNVIKAIPKDWLINRIEAVAENTVNFEDEWEYRRLLYFYDLIDPALVERLALRGLKSSNFEVIEIANDHLAP
ncbi:hypothetical protein FEM03_16005 [Phragmitibacter flavus]|uniref:Immunity protein 30 domain-containing protein n=1 Tax=Phragmitibacter flavus TaxID=2576071 RepID=A0A5R8KD27_9BACT|nr:hypothetical protein [Phragmitibacter flavus]TLD69825.1 hypothetical protein FEM03_16005 [Phragmitibacter flavus]